MSGSKLNHAFDALDDKKGELSLKDRLILAKLKFKGTLGAVPGVPSHTHFVHENEIKVDEPKDKSGRQTGSGALGRPELKLTPPRPFELLKKFSKTLSKETQEKVLENVLNHFEEKLKNRPKGAKILLNKDQFQKIRMGLSHQGELGELIQLMQQGFLSSVYGYLLELLQIYFAYFECPLTIQDKNSLSMMFTQHRLGYNPKAETYLNLTVEHRNPMHLNILSFHNRNLDPERYHGPFHNLHPNLEPTAGVPEIENSPEPENRPKFHPVPRLEPHE